jgi:hypothetical protein
MEISKSSMESTLFAELEVSEASEVRLELSPAEIAALFAAAVFFIYRSVCR